MSTVGWPADMPAHRAGLKPEEPPPVPNYRLLRIIGRGSFGEVWLALDAMNKWSAVKVVWWRAEDEGRAYRREFAGLKRYDDLSGGGGWLMPIRNVHCDEERRFFSYAMELADDVRTLAPLHRLESDDPGEAERRAKGYQPRILSGELRRRGRLSPSETVEIGLALCQSVERLHAGNLLHRDIKPSNIIFVGGQPKLADIGLVAAADATLVSFAGTSGFVPLQGAGTVSGDLFALGKVLYMMATGNPAEEFPKVSGDFSSLGDTERAQLAELQAVFDRACEPEPNDRQPSAKTLRQELELLRQNESVLHLRELETRDRRRRKHWRRAQIAAGIILPVIAITVGFLALWIQRQNLQHRALVAELERRQLFRNGERLSGWSRTDWASAQKAVTLGRADGSILRQAVGTLSDVDAITRSMWADMEATDVAFSRDGQAITAGFDKSPAWWITEGTHRQALPVSGEGKVAWSPDGVPLILQADTNGLVLRDLRTGDVRQRFSIPGRKDTSERLGPAIALSHDGSWVAARISGTAATRIALWEASTGTLKAEQILEASALQFSPDGGFLGVGHSDGQASLWRVPGLEAVAHLPAALGTSPVQALAFGRHGSVDHSAGGPHTQWRLATGSRGTGIAVWDLALPSPIAFCRGSAWEVQALTFSPDGSILASAGRLGVRLWDPTSGQPLLYTDYPSSNTRALAFDPTGRTLLAGSTSEVVPAETWIWAIEPNRGIQTLRGLTTAIRKTAWSEDGRWLAAVSEEWKIAVWERASGIMIGCFEVPLEVYADSAGISFAKDGSLLAIANGREVRTLQIPSGKWGDRWMLPMGHGKEVRFLDRQRLRVASLEISPGRSPSRRWVVHELNATAEPRELARQSVSEPETMNFLLSPDGTRLLVMGWDESRWFNHVRCINLDTGATVWTRKTVGYDSWSVMRVDPSGHWAAFRTRLDGPYRVVDLSEGRTAFEMPQVSRLAALSPVQPWFAVPAAVPGSFAETLSLRRMDSPADALPLGTDERPSPDTVAFSRDGRYLAWGTVDGTVAVADVEQVRRAVTEFLRMGSWSGDNAADPLPVQDSVRP